MYSILVRKDKTRNKIFKEVVIQSLLIELEDKLLQCFRHYKRIVRTRVLKKALELKFEGTRPMV
jgi:hypothetical protein